MEAILRRQTDLPLILSLLTLDFPRFQFRQALRTARSGLAETIRVRGLVPIAKNVPFFGLAYYLLRRPKLM